MIVVTVTKETGVTDLKYEVKLSVPFKKAVNTQEDTKSALEWDELSEKLRWDSAMLLWLTDGS